MSRREIVLLVSRAVAILTIITALINSFINLPYQAFLLSQQIRWQNAYSSSHIHVAQFQWIGFGISLTRIAALLLVAGLFWRCGPRIERLFLPAETQEKLDTLQ
jgi:hypothetical protein